MNKTLNKKRMQKLNHDINKAEDSILNNTPCYSESKEENNETLKENEEE